MDRDNRMLFSAVDVSIIVEFEGTDTIRFVLMCNFIADVNIVHSR